MRAIILAAAICIPTAVWAQGVPRYDPPTYCEGIAKMADGSRVIYNSCVKMEQDAYNDLKGEWSDLPATTRSYCDGIARTGDGTYVILKSCIDMEADAAKSEPAFKF